VARKGLLHFLKDFCFVSEVPLALSAFELVTRAHLTSVTSTAKTTGGAQLLITVLILPQQAIWQRWLKLTWLLTFGVGVIGVQGGDPSLFDK